MDYVWQIHPNINVHLAYISDDKARSTSEVRIDMLTVCKMHSISETWKLACEKAMALMQIRKYNGGGALPGWGRIYREKAGLFAELIMARL